MRPGEFASREIGAPAAVCGRMRAELSQNHHRRVFARARDGVRTRSIHLCVGLMPALEPLGDGVQFGIVATLRLDFRDSG